jgi:hypothetical protein
MKKRAERQERVERAGERETKDNKILMPTKDYFEG